MIQGLSVQTKATFQLFQILDVKLMIRTILKEYLKSSSSHATYISITIQNDLIKACGEHISDMNLEEVRSCRFFSIIDDEATNSSNSEQLSIVLQFVDDKMDVTEEFMGFVECKTGVTGEA